MPSSTTRASSSAIVSSSSTTTTPGPATGAGSTTTTSGGDVLIALARQTRARDLTTCSASGTATMANGLPASPTRTVALGPIVYFAELHIRQIPARMQAPEKLKDLRTTLLGVLQRHFRSARSLRRWVACIYAPAGDPAELTVQATFERLIATSRIDNLTSSWITRFRWREPDGSTFQAQRGHWKESKLMGWAFCDLQPRIEGYTAVASKMIETARRNDASMLEVSNIQPPPLPLGATNIDINSNRAY